MNRKPFSTITSAVCAALTLFCIGGGGGVMSGQAGAPLPPHGPVIGQRSTNASQPVRDHNIAVMAAAAAVLHGGGGASCRRRP